MIPVPSGVRVWLAVGRTDMRLGMNELLCRSRKLSGVIPMPVISTCSEASEAT